MRGLPSARAPSTPALRTCRAEFSKGRCAPVPRAVVLCVRACVPACACVCVCSGGEAWSDPARPLPLLATRACERCVGRQHLRGQFFPREMERILPARDVRELATVPNMPVTTPLHTHTQCPICRSRPPTHTHCPTCRSRPPTPTSPPVPTMPVAAPCTSHPAGGRLASAGRGCTGRRRLPRRGTRGAWRGRRGRRSKSQCWSLTHVAFNWHGRRWQALAVGERCG